MVRMFKQIDKVEQMRRAFEVTRIGASIRGQGHVHAVHERCEQSTWHSLRKKFRQPWYFASQLILVLLANPLFARACWTFMAWTSRI